MKIAIDIRAAIGEKAGKGWYTFHIVKNLLEEDRMNFYILYCSQKDEATREFENFKNAEIRPIPGRGMIWHYQVARDCRREQIDLFFAPTSYIIPAILPKEIKTLITVHDLVAFLFPQTHQKKATLVEKTFLRRALKRATHVTTVSENTKKDLIEKFHIAPEKITTAYCAADPEFKPIPKTELENFVSETNLPDQFFLAVGTIEPRKNYINLIKAFAIFHQYHPHPELLIVGREGWDYEEVYNEIRVNYLTNKVHVLGYLSNVGLRNLYNLAQAFVFPSFYEGFGIPPLEAMQCGCPVIASYSSSIPEVVGESALLINPNSTTDIAHAMNKILKDHELAEKLSRKGLQHATRFSWANSAKVILGIIEKMQLEQN